MKRDRNFYYILIIILFVVSYVAAFVLGNRTIEFGNLIATASVIFYPMTYFCLLNTVFCHTSLL